MRYPRKGEILTSPISFSSSGDNTVVASSSGKRILIHRIWLIAGGATSITFQNGTTALSGACPIASYGSITFDNSDEPWFETSLSSAFVINSTSAVQISGQVYYTYGT